jgi:hypothetical protein
VRSVALWCEGIEDLGVTGLAFVVSEPGSRSSRARQVSPELRSGNERAMPASWLLSMG